MLEKIISTLAPHACIGCGSEGSLLCVMCAHDLIPAVPSRCYRCYAVTVDSAVCTKCRSKTALRHVWVRTDYANTPQELVYRLKFERARAAAIEIANLLDESLPYFPSGTVVTFIPTASSRVRIRGYDQTKIIAQYFARKRKLPCKPLLIRIGQSRQVRSKRAQRITQAQQNYKIKHRATYPEQVLIIDDITTTGATIESAARILKNAGISNVNAAIFAQKH